MKLPDSATTTSGLFRALQRPDCGLLPRIAASIITGLGYAAFAPIVLIAFNIDQRPSYDQDVILCGALAGTALAWLATMMWIWRGFSRGAQLLRASILTVTVVCAAFVAGVLIVWTSFADDYLLVSVALFTGAAVVLIWTPVGMHFARGRSVMQGDGVVDVTCPTCGYLLVGLSELRCPECGTRFTIDSLIKAQHYSSRTP